MDHAVTYVTGSYRSRQPSSTQTISFMIQPDSQNQLLIMQIPSCLVPFKTRITGQSQSDSASWRAVQESQVTVHSHSTAALQRSLKMAEHLSCSQFKDLGLMCREKIEGLPKRIMQKRSSYYINNCLLLNPKGRAIKALMRTNTGWNQFACRSV